MSSNVPDVAQLTATHGDLSSLAGAPMVAVSSVMFTNLRDPYEAARFAASIAATRAYKAASVPQIVMVDNRSIYTVAERLGEAGAIVVPTPRPGLYLPYADGARLVRRYAGKGAGALKAESDKKMSKGDLQAVRDRLRTSEIVVGVRSPMSMNSMHPVQRRTEWQLDNTIFPSTLPRLPHGLSCGVQAYRGKGLDLLLQYEQHMHQLGNNWKYLLFVPAVGLSQDLRVTGAGIDIRYDPAMVALEDDLRIVLKRYEQFVLMSEGAAEVARMLPGSWYAAAPDTSAAEAHVARLRALVQRAR